MNFVKNCKTSPAQTKSPTLLPKEVRQTKPLPLEQEAFANLQRTAALLMQGVEARLGCEGITPTQYNILRILRGAGPSGIRCGEIAARLVTQVPDVTRLLDRLYRRRLLDRLRIQNDRRVVLVCITPEGLRLLKALDAPVLELQQEYFRRLTRPQIAAFNSMCVQLREETRE